MPKIISNKSNVDLDYPVVRPSLDLDFTQEELDPRITYSRGSIGTRVNRNRLIETVAANQPRFDYDPVTGECKGLLIEESRQNLLTYSEDFSNAVWNTSQASILTSSIVSPSGSTSFKLIENTTANVGHLLVRGNISKASNAVLTFTVFAKAAERQYMGLVINSFSTGFPNRYGAEFNLGNGTARNNNPAQGTYSSGSFSIQPYPNGWYRCTITCTTSTDATSQVRIFTFRDVNQWTSAASYSGDGTSGIYIWGAQVETGAFPTTYIPTTASTVTRSADNANMTGNNFSSWYNSSQGTLYANAISNANTNHLPGIAALNDSAAPTTYRVDLRYYQGGNSYTFFGGVNGGGGSLTRTSGFLLINPKFVTSYSIQNISFAANGSLIRANVPIFTPSNLINRLLIGTFDAGNQYYLNGTISRLTYYPRALKPNQLQYLTQ